VRKKKPSPVDVEVGRRIRLQRLSAGMSQTELGNRIGVTFQQVQKYEKGVNRVGAGRLTEIAAILNVPVTVFFDGAAEPTVGKHESLTELLTRPHSLKLLQAYSAIDNDKVRLSILHLVEAIIDERLH
jgi:transcriptional regulator with XRE-family HTH domain